MVRWINRRKNRYAWITPVVTIPWKCHINCDETSENLCLIKVRKSSKPLKLLSEGKIDK